jgi:hypothetical protein
MPRVKDKRVTSPRIVQPGASVRPWLVVALLAVIGGWTWATYDLGLERAGFHSDAASDRHAGLRAEARTLKKERDELLLAVANLERSSQIDRNAALQAQQQIKKLQAERAALKREVAFMRKLLEANDGPIRVRDFRLEEADEDRLYLYRFVVAQAQEGGDVLEGEIRIAVRGRAGEAARYMRQEELSEDKAKGHKMRFRNFQEVEGRLRLPANFIPEVFVVEVAPESRKLQGLQKEFDWKTPET